MDVGTFNLDIYDEKKHLPTLNAFIQKRYDTLVSILNNNLFEENTSIYANLAIAYQIIGDKEKSYYYYGLTPGSIIKDINYLSFCHRYFLYGMIKNDFYIPDSPLKLLYIHNYTNYIYRTKGIREARYFIKQHSIYELLNNNKYGEQLLNEIYNCNNIKPKTKAGLTLIDQLPYKRSYNLSSSNKEKQIIGLYVSDIQRHRNASIIFEVIESLKNDFSIVVFFDNLFENKLYRLLDNVTKCINISHMYLSEICRLWDVFKLDGLIDFTDNRLRNNLIAFLPHKDNIWSISYLLKAAPLLLNSKSYYGNIDCNENKKNDNILFLGDFYLVTDACLKELVAYIKPGKKLIFMDYAFEEPLFSKYFQESLLKYGFKTQDFLTLPIVKPFSQYMKFLHSIDEIFFVCENSLVKLSEALKTRNKITNLSTNEVFNCTYKAFDDKSLQYNRDDKIQLSRDRFSKLITIKIKSTIKYNFNYIIKDDNKYIITYHDNKKTYYIDYTCNGDFIVYSN